MTQEEKLKEAKRLYETANADQKYVLERLFPELAESEDERIRKDLIAYLRGILYNEKYGDKFIESWIAWLEKQGKTSPVLSNSSNTGKDEQKPAEDRYMEGYLNGTNDALKTLKPAAWSEEDEEIIDYLIDYLESELDSSYTDLDKETFTKEINWLKSLRPQSHWKPSDEQMDALNDVISSRDIKYDVLSELWKDLKKLRKE